jgi:hypothetical protein
MDMIYGDKLAAMVAARNRLHDAAREQLPAMLAALAPFVGKKVASTTSETLLEQVKKALPESPCKPKLHWFYVLRYGAVRVVIKVMEAYFAGYDHADTVATYAETSLHLGEVDKSGVLVRLTTGHKFPEHYTVDQVLGFREQLKAARKVVRDAKRDPIYRFFGDH